VARREYISLRRAQALDLSRLLVHGMEPATVTEDEGLDARLLALKAACDTLGDADREVLLLTNTQGLSSEAAANVLGISNTALRQRLARARRRLTKCLAGQARDEAEALTKGAR
jgi:RNA polymerase sigma factor (sigma-70 family)